MKWSKSDAAVNLRKLSHCKIYGEFRCEVKSTVNYKMLISQVHNYYDWVLILSFKTSDFWDS